MRVSPMWGDRNVWSPFTLTYIDRTKTYELFLMLSIFLAAIDRINLMSQLPMLSIYLTYIDRTNLPNLIATLSISLASIDRTKFLEQDKRDII